MTELTSKSHVDQYGNLYFDISFRDGDELIEKRVPAEVYISLLNGNVREDETFVTIPKMPENMIAAQIGAKDKSSFSCLSVYRADKRAFAISGQFYRLPFPTLLMYAKVNKGVRQEVKIFVLDTDDPTDDSVLYHYPFGNVYEDGRVCMGNIVSTGLSSLADADRVFEDFICGVTNEHLYRLYNRLGLSQLELVKHIEQMEQFPVELLVPMENLTIGALKKQLRF